MAAHSTGPRTWDGKIRLDIGCGKNCKADHIGVDMDETLKVDIVHNLENAPLPIPDLAIDEIYTSHFLEHLSGMSYMHVVNEFWRVLVVGGKVTIIVPYFRTKVAVQDPTHRMQFDVDSFKYLDREASAWDYYNNPLLYCNFEIESNELKGKDFEHLMVHTTLVKKEMPVTLQRATEGQAFAPISEGPGPGMCTGFRIPGVVLGSEPPIVNNEEIGEFMKKELGIPWEESIVSDFVALVQKFPAIFNVAAECAQLREVHQKTAFNVLGEDGFIQELLNVQRKFVRVYGMALSGSEDVSIMKLRKNMFDLVNYAIATLETLDKEIENGGVAVTRKIVPNGNVNHMVEAAVRDSGGYPEGTTINTRLLPV